MLCPLDKNEKPYDLPESVKKLFLETARDIPFNRYPDPDHGELRENLSSYCGFPAERIVLGNGGDELLWMIFTKYVGPRDVVLAFSPTFSEYHRLAGLFKADLQLIPADLDGDEPVFDYDSFIRAASETSPSLVLLDTPNNPTGLTHPASFIGKVVSLAEPTILVDEAYGEFARSTWLDSMKGEDLPKNVAVLKTMSKAWGLAGLRFGYAVCGERTASELSDVRAPFNVNSLTAAAAEIALEHRSLLFEGVRGITRLRDNFIQEVNSLDGWRAFLSDGNFVLIRAPVAWDRMASFLEGISLKRIFHPLHEAESRCLVRVSVGNGQEMDFVSQALLRIQKEVGCHD